MPSVSSWRNLFERTLGVSPGVAFRSWLNLSIFIMAMSLRIRIVHLRPRTPRLVAIGQLLMGTTGSSNSEESSGCPDALSGCFFSIKLGIFSISDI